MKARLTTHSIAAAVCPPGKSEILLWDAGCAGLAVRVHRNGAKTWCLRYRQGKGRAAPIRRLTLGSVDKLGPAEARTAARKWMGEVALGADPAAKVAGDKAEATAAKRAALGVAIDDYEAELARRRIVKRKEIVSALRRELRDRLGAATDVRHLTRRTIVERLDELAQDRPGAAGYLRKATTGFLEWLCNGGVITASPLAGYRKPRRSRAERVGQPGRALDDSEIRALWPATGNRFGALVRVCLLTGARRGEAAAMEWRDLDLDTGEWTIRAEVAKTGRPRVIYLAPAAVELLRAVPRIEGVALVFPSDAGTVITGWTKRVAAVVKASGVDFTMHDTRRTFRTGLRRVGVDKDTAELCLGHWRGELVEAYDRDEGEARQRDAFARWVRHVLALVKGGSGKVVRLRQTGR